jgi:hypothetical protein
MVASFRTIAVRGIPHSDRDEAGYQYAYTGSVSVMDSNPKCVTRSYVSRMAAISFMHTSHAIYS